MFGGKRVLFFAALALLVSGCVAPATKSQDVDPELAAREAEKQRELAAIDYRNNVSRIDNIGYVMLRAGVELCGERVRPAFGFTLLSAEDFQGDYYETYRRLNKYSNQAHVVGIADGSPAASSNLKLGDAVLAIDGVPIPAEEGSLNKVFGELYEDGIGESLTFTVRSWGEDEREVTVYSEPICDYSLQYRLDDLVNAHADGDNVVIYSGMTRFAVSDTELAAIIGHEIAHNAMGHLDAKKINSVAGAGVGLLFEILAAAAGVNTGGEFIRAGANIGAGVYSKEFEAEADYVGLYLMARAGMTIDAVPNFWRRMAVSHPGAIASNHGATHPATPERFLALETAVEEITGKIAVGAALLPDMAIEPSPRTTAIGATGTAFKAGTPQP